MTTEPVWVDDERGADAALTEITRYQIAGLDTEFDGLDINTQSCVGLSKCHVFSVAVPSGPLLPRGFNEASSFVFSANLLGYRPLKEWLEDPSYTKPLHNQPVDAHTLRNSGVCLRGGQNTLAMARFWWPERAKAAGFGLDSVSQDFCGVGKTESFDELLGYDAIEYRPRAVWKKRCACGQLGCMKKKEPHDVKTPEEVVVDQPFKVRRHIPLVDLVHGHALWSRYLEYAARDAVLALWIYQLMLRDGARQRPFPWSIDLGD